MIDIGDAPETPAPFKSKVIRCLWEYADGLEVGESLHLFRQGIRALSEPGCTERVFMAGGSTSRHTPLSKSSRLDAYRNLADWSRWGADRPNFTGLLAVQWGGNMLDEWLPDFLAAAEFGWTPPVKRKGRATIMSSTGRQSWTTILGLCDNPKPKEKKTIK